MEFLFTSGSSQALCPNHRAKGTVVQPGSLGTLIHGSNSLRTVPAPEALGLCFATSLFGRGTAWDCLGYVQVDRQDHGRIHITRCDVHFRTIQLRVNGGPIFFDRLGVHFDDGTSQKLVFSGRISPGEGTT